GRDRRQGRDADRVPGARALAVEAVGESRRLGSLSPRLLAHVPVPAGALRGGGALLPALDRSRSLFAAAVRGALLLPLAAGIPGDQQRPGRRDPAGARAC